MIKELYEYWRGKFYANLFARLAVAAKGIGATTRETNALALASMGANPDSWPRTARGDALKAWAKLIGVDSSGSDEDIQARCVHRLRNP